MLDVGLSATIYPGREEVLTSNLRVLFLATSHGLVPAPEE